MDKAIMIFTVKKNIYVVMWTFTLMLCLCFFSCRGHHKQKTQPKGVKSSAGSKPDLSRCDLSKVLKINGMNPELLSRFRPLRETDVLLLDIFDYETFVRGMAKELCAIGTPVWRSQVIRGEEVLCLNTKKIKRPIGVAHFWPLLWKRFSELDGWSPSELLIFQVSVGDESDFKTTEGPNLNSALNSLDPNRCFVSLYTSSPKGTEWGMFCSHLKNFKYIRIETNADLNGLEELKQLRYMDLEWEYPDAQRRLDKKLARLKKLETLKVGWITNMPVISLPQIKNLTIKMEDAKWLRSFPKVEAVTVTNYLSDAYV